MLWNVYKSLSSFSLLKLIRLGFSDKTESTKVTFQMVENLIPIVTNKSSIDVSLESYSTRNQPCCDVTVINAALFTYIYIYTIYTL